MKHTRKRALSLILSGIMTASMLPSYLTQLSIPAAADDPPASDYTPDTDPTIDFDYADTHNILNAEDALRDLAAWGKKLTSITPDDVAEGKVAGNYASYNKFPWKHASKITCHEHSKGSIRTFLESTSPNDTFIALSDSEEYHTTENEGYEWEPIRITTDKVLDLNGHRLTMRHGGNVNNSVDDPRQEYGTEEAFYMTMFEIDEGATLTIIDSSEWRVGREGTGKIGFYGDYFDIYNWDYERYTQRDLFHVMNGNLIIYGGTYEAGKTNVQKKKVSEFSWKKLQTAIGTAVELGVNIAKYATGISTAEAGYQDALKKVADIESGTANPKPLETNETQKNQPNDKNSGRNQSVSEKAAEKDKKIADGKERGTPEGENTADSEGKAKDDTNTMVAKAKNEVVNQVVNKDGIMGMVNSGFSLVDQIVDMCGTKSYPPIADTIMGTAVRVGTAGTFASYGGTYIGYGSTPDTRNAVVEVLVDPGENWPRDHSKKDGGKAYIYDGDFKADAGANVFNICRDKGKAEYQVRSYKEGEDGSMSNTITFDEHYGVEELFYQNQDKLGKGMIGNGKVYDEYGTEIVPEPITTANIQVRGGTFHCHYNLMNAAKLEKGAEELEHGHTEEPYFRRCPGTSGMVNLGVDSFGADLIRDGRIQIVDNSAGCLVLMDDRQVGDKGLYHYRLYCGDNELRTKSNIKVYPNNDAQINASNSMQLATYYGADGQTNKIFTEDEKGENIRSPYRQTENYFDFQLDAVNRAAYSVKPNFRNTETGQMDVYGKKTSASEVWYYPAPLDYNGNPIGQIPKDKKGNPLSDVAYGYTRLKYYGDKNDLYKIVGHDQYQAIYMGHNMDGRDYYYLVDRDVLDDSNWNAIMSEYKNYNATWSKDIIEYTNIRTNMKYFTYKVYQVDPLTRENLNANGKYAGDDPLLTVRYGCAPEETALRCKLPLDEVERRIKKVHPEWQGYRAGEMYRIVLEVEEHIGIGEQRYSTFNYNMGDFGKTLKPATTTTSILFRCYEAAEGYEAEGHQERQYYDTDFTPLQWPAYPTNMHTIPAGQKHTIELRNGKTGMVDWEADARVFDIYYQWWEVDEEGNPLKLLAGTDNVFNDGRSKYNEHGAGNDSYKKELQTEIAEEKAASTTDDDTVYELKDKAKHHPGGWKLKYEKPDGERFHYANIVDPNETQEQMMDDPEYPNITGLPGFVTEQECKWTAEQLHMYTAETTEPDILKINKSQNLTLYNNDMFVNQTDSCYIPMEMIGKRVRVCAIALNMRWPLAFDKKQTFWSHTMEVCDPNSPEGYLNIKTDENEEFGEDVPATFSVQKLRDFYDGNNKISSVTYIAYGKYKTFGFDRDKIVTNIAALPSAKYPKDFSDIREGEPDLWQDFHEDYQDYDGACVLIGLTDDFHLDQIQYYRTEMDAKYVKLYPAPEISGTFTIKPDKNYDPNKLDATQSATFSVTGLKGMNAGETISGVTYYAFGKEKVFEDLSVYDLKDIPEARYPSGFTEMNSLLASALKQRHGDVFVKVTTSKGSQPYREVYLEEEYPQQQGKVKITYDEDMSYATYDHPAKLSLENFSGLAYNEEVTAISYKLLGSTSSVTFTREDNPEKFADGLPSATYPDDFLSKKRLDHGYAKQATFGVTVTIERKSPKQASTGGTIDRFTGIISSEGSGGSVSTGIRKETGIVEGSMVIGTGIRKEIGTVEGSTVIGTGKEQTLTLTKSDDVKPFVSSIINGKSSTRELTFYPDNFEKFRYVVKAEKIERSGDAVEEFKRSDILNGKYDKGIVAFVVQPADATIGYDFSDYTVTNDKVAVLVQDPNVSFWTKIMLTGELGEATFSMQSPDGETVTKTVRVINDYNSVEISGIQAPVIGEKFDFDSVKVPDGAPYHIKEVKWYKGTRLDKEVGADAVAEYFNPYTVRVTVEPNECCMPASDVSYQLKVTQPDGTAELVSSDSFTVRQDFDEENYKYLPSYTIQYTFPAQSNHEASVIDEIHIDFPTEVEEGTNWDDFVKNVHVNTNGYDEGFKFDIRQSFGPDAESLASALGYSIDLKKPTALRFVKGIQNGIIVDINIPEELLKLGDVFADEVSVYINGEVQKVKSYGYDYAKQITIKAPDTLTITDGEVPEAMPRYSMKSANAVVGETININDLLVCDDSRVSIRMNKLTHWTERIDDYVTYDLDAGTVTPLQKDWHGFDLYYTVSFDANKDKKPDYEKTGVISFSEIYATASDVPEPDTTHTGTARVTLLNPDGTEASKVDYPIRAGKNIPEVKNAFLESCCDAGEKSVDPYYFENGKRYTAKTVSVDDFKIYAGADTVYGFISDQDGTDISGIQISVDGKHFYAGDRITGLTPDTAYTLYYRQYTDGTVYTKEFRTAKQDYGVYIGRQPVTDANLGDLEKDGWAYDPAGKTLTLKDFSIKDKGAVAKIRDYEGFADITNAVISSQDEITVKLIGDNSLQGTGRYVVVGIYAEKSLTIEGNGNLNIIGGEYGIQSNSSSIYLDGTGTLHFDRPQIYGLYTQNGIVEYTNGTIHSEGCTFMNDRKEKLDLSGKKHDLNIRIGSFAEDAAEVTEAEFAEATGAYLTITPQHHDVNKVTSAESYESGTCDKGCLYHLSCDCGHIGEKTFTAEAEEHVLVKHEAKPATCEQAGAPAYWECTHCGGRYADAAGTKPLAEKDMVIPALGHKLTHHAAKDATCDTAGSIEYWECSTCGERFADEAGKTPLPDDAELTVSATGHEWVQVFSKSATCDKDGCIEHWACKNCGKFSADKEGKKLLKAEDLVIPAFGHSWSAWTVSKEATETEEGEAVRVCSVCGETEKQTIPVKEPVITTTVPVTTTAAKATTTTAKATTTAAKATTAAVKATTTAVKATTTAAKVTTTAAKATTTAVKATTTAVKATTTAAKVTTTAAKATTTAAKATTTAAKATTTAAKATTTAAKATTTVAQATTTAVKATTTAVKATTTAAKATTTAAKATTTAAQATTTAAKATTTTAKATTTTAQATTTAAKATTTTAKATTTAASVTTTVVKATTTTAKATTTTEQITTTVPETTTTQSATTTAVTSEGGTDTTPAVTTTTGSEITPPETETLRGDTNGDGKVSVDDAQMTLKAYTFRIAGKEMNLNEQQIKAADIDENGIISVEDAQLILKYYTQKTVAGKDITWDDIFVKKPQPLPPMQQQEEFLFDPDRYLPDDET